MAGGLGGRVVVLLDWCWPFPLGIVASTLALVMATGIWLAIRDPQPPQAGRPLGQAGSTKIPAHVPSTLPSPAQYAPPAAPNPTAVRMPSRPTTAREASPAATLIRPEPGGRVAAPAALAKPQVAQLRVQPRPVAPQLSAAQQAEITDRLTIGRFLMNRKDYSAAINEFQAALAVDPASREAQAAIQQAREAGKQLESRPLP